MEETQNTANPKSLAVPVNSVTSAGAGSPSAASLSAPKDKKLEINQREDSDQSSAADAKAGDSEEVIIHRPDSPSGSSAADGASASTPVTVTEEEVNKVKEPMDLDNKIEILAGEIQSLEARIDRLVSSATPLSNYSGFNERPAETAKSTQATVTPAVSNPVKPVPVSSKPADDIYTANETKAKQTQMGADDEGETDDSRSIAGGIGSLLVSLGIVIMIIILALPLVKEMIGKNIFAVSQGVGWPLVLGLLGIGGIVLLFSTGRMVVKILALVFLLIAALMYMGVLGYASFLGPLGPSLGSVFSFYR